VVAEKIILGQVTGNYRPKSLLANLARPFGICGNPKERSGSTGSASSSSFRSLVAFPLTRRRLNIPLCASLLWARKLRGRCAHAASKHKNHCCGEWRYPFRFSDTHEFSSQVLRQRDQLVNSSSDLATVGGRNNPFSSFTMRTTFCLVAIGRSGGKSLSIHQA
jgi:hypothetical protein